MVNEGTMKTETAPKRTQKTVIPRRRPSIVIPNRRVVYITPDKTTCVECPCYPQEEPYFKPKKLNPCLKTPLTLYELAAKVVDTLKFPEAFGWSEEDVAEWMSDVVGLPQYRECILENHINGMRLIMLEDPSNLPAINIHNFEDLKRITAFVRRVYSTEFVKFCRSIGLPPRKPLTHCTWFKSRTGRSWGIRQNWTRCDILRWMKIINPAPINRNHWDLVWYRQPDFPKTKFARIKKPISQVHIPRYVPAEEDICREYQAPRKFKLQQTEDVQLIWLEHRPGSPLFNQDLVKKEPKTLAHAGKPMVKKTRLDGLVGKDLILARRKLPKAKFFV